MLVLDGGRKNVSGKKLNKILMNVGSDDILYFIQSTFSFVDNRCRRSKAYFSLPFVKGSLPFLAISYTFLRKWRFRSRQYFSAVDITGDEWRGE